jgi:hypothetical protein
VTRWPLEPLRALRALGEERAAGELSRRRAAEAEAGERAAALASALAAARADGGRGEPAASLANAARFLERKRVELAEAVWQAERAGAAAREAARGHARARRDLEVLERARGRWAEARVRARDAALERELDDLALRVRAQA